MAKIDLADLMATVSKLDTSAAAPEIRMIPLEDILSNINNFYQLRDLEPLADSIAMTGLQQPLVVVPTDSAGKYRLISGHRRRAALERLVKDREHPREDLRLVPCMVQTYASSTMERLQLILANSTARELTNAEKTRQAEEIETLFYRLKEEGYEFPGRMRDQVAKACKISAPKLARLKVIREKLKAAELVYLFEKDKLTEQAAYALARLPAAFQSRIAKAAGGEAPSGGAAERVLEKYNSGWRWEPDLRCPDGKPCRRGDTFLRHDLDHPYDMCGGQKCCLECPRAKDGYSPCDRMCSKAQAARKAKRDEAAAQKKERADARAKEAQAETQQNAQRLLPVIDAAGLPDDSKFNWGYWEKICAGDVRRWAAGDFSDSKRTWTEPLLSPKRLENPGALAELLGCSTDFLLGVTDDPTPSVAKPRPQKVDFLSGDLIPVPKPDTPPAEGWVPLRWRPGQERPTKDRQLAVVWISVAGIDLLEVARWSMAHLAWRYPQGGEIMDDAECRGWFPLPETEDDDAG